ncbi:MAG: RNase P subunit p30 family protein [Candidatus Hodarchaeales archaeon]
MQRKFVDYITPVSSSDLRTILEMSKLLGYSRIWLGRQWNTEPIDGNNLSSNQSIELVNRLDIDSSKISKEKIVQILRRERRNFPIISVKCTDPEIVGWAAQDNRIDILVFPQQLIGKLFSRSIAKLMIKFVKYLEISLSDLYLSPERIQIPMFRQIRQAIEIAQIKSVPIIINSGAANQTQVRSPWDLISLSQVLFSKKEPPLEAISTTPNKLLSSNQVKISNDYLAPGFFRATENNNHVQEEE